MTDRSPLWSAPRAVSRRRDEQGRPHAHAGLPTSVTPDTRFEGAPNRPGRRTHDSAELETALSRLDLVGRAESTARSDER